MTSLIQRIKNIYKISELQPTALSEKTKDGEIITVLKKPKEFKPAQIIKKKIDIIEQLTKN